MKRGLLLVTLLLSTTISFSQIKSIEKDVATTKKMLLERTSNLALKYWQERGTHHKTDSLFSWANVDIALAFMYVNDYEVAERLLDTAEQWLETQYSENSWWLNQRGYFSLHKAILLGHLHNYSLMQRYAADAKVSFEKALNFGFNYAYTLSILALAARLNGDKVIARVFSGEALSYAFEFYKNLNSIEQYELLSSIVFEASMIEASLGYYDYAIEPLLILKNINKELGVDNFKVDYYLGGLYINKNNFENTFAYLDPIYPKINNITEKIHCGLNLLYAKYLLDHQDVEQLALEIIRLQATNIDNMFSFMSSQEKEKWWMSSYEHRVSDVPISILLKSGLNKTFGIITDSQIFSKGVLLRSTNLLREVALSSEDNELITRYNVIEKLNSELITTTDENEYAELIKQISALEKELQNDLDIRVNEVASWRDVANSLSSKEVALEFMCIENIKDSNNPDYYVSIVKKGDVEPNIIHLCDELSIQPLLENKSNKPAPRYVQDLYSTDSLRGMGKRLYQLIWSKIESELTGYSTIYYSPAGLLNSVAMQAISNGNNYLGDKYKMHLVSSIGVIPQIKDTHNDRRGQIVVYGGIQYDVDEPKLREAASQYASATAPNWQGDISQTRAGWKFLEGTEKEANQISSMVADSGVKVTTITGIEANEESFKALSGTNVNTIHIATHGFFLSSPREIRRSAFLNSSPSNEKGKVDPMIRSGLLFSGGNRAWTGKRQISGIEDGVLTAKEISTMNLSKTDLVVLSACETGLGDVQANEGVFGLQRAFKLAGVKSLIMSLWEVDDVATRVMMTAFYEKYLSGVSKIDAFNYAVHSVRNYKDNYGAKPFENPYYWAGFVLMD